VSSLCVTRVQAS